MSSELIPHDPLTRKQLAKVLAQMIRDDFEKARAERYRAQKTATTVHDDDGQCRAD